MGDRPRERSSDPPSDPAPGPGRVRGRVRVTSQKPAELFDGAGTVIERGGFEGAVAGVSDRGRDDHRIDTLIDNAHDVIAEWDDMRPTTYSELSESSKIILEELLKEYLPQKLAETISKEYVRYPADMQQQFVDKDVGAGIGKALYCARMLLPNHFGLKDNGEIDIDLTNKHNEVLKEYDLALTGVIALAHNTRDFSESATRVIEKMARQPVKTAVKAMLVPFAVKVAAELAPVGTAIVNSARSGGGRLTELAGAISDYAFDSRSAAIYAAVYVAITNIDKLLPPEAQAGDLKGIFDDLSKRSTRDSRERVTGPMPDTSTGWGVVNYVFWRGKTMCFDQAKLAIDGANSVFNLAAEAPNFCTRLVGTARQITSAAATGLESGDPRGVTDVTCIAFHDKLRDLLEHDERFASLKDNASVKKHMDNLQRADPRQFFLFERRVEFLAATELVQAINPQDVIAHMRPQGSQEAQPGSQPNLDDVNSQAAAAQRAVSSNVTDLLGPDGEWLGEIPINPENSNDTMSDHGGGRSRSRKRSASKRTHRKGAAKKQKSKKNKRQSRRKSRRSSSRKAGRK